MKKYKYRKYKIINFKKQHSYFKETSFSMFSAGRRGTYKQMTNETSQLVFNKQLNWSQNLVTLKSFCLLLFNLHSINSDDHKRVTLNLVVSLSVQAVHGKR